MAVQQDAVRVAAQRDAPQCRHAVGLHFSVGHRLGFYGGQMQVFHDVPNRCQIEARLRDPFLDRRVELIHLPFARWPFSLLLLSCGGHWVETESGGSAMCRWPPALLSTICSGASPAARGMETAAG